MITRQQKPADYSEPQRNLFEEVIHAGDEGQRKGSEEGGRRVLTSRAGCAQLVGGLRVTTVGGVDQECSLVFSWKILSSKGQPEADTPTQPNKARQQPSTSTSQQPAATPPSDDIIRRSSATPFFTTHARPSFRGGRLPPLSLALTQRCVTVSVCYCCCCCSQSSPFSLSLSAVHTSNNTSRHLTALQPHVMPLSLLFHYSLGIYGKSTIPGICTYYV
jgi:hypothetical protein